jgi:hypothetical protein
LSAAWILAAPGSLALSMALATTLTASKPRIPSTMPIQGRFRFFHSSTYTRLASGSPAMAWS